ncbi:MAG: heme-copper oxidase subunit III [Elusimicrobia bacterium]|nr:heme-copper oxidase subunit III [Elusimicrobiota bacterium]
MNNAHAQEVSATGIPSGKLGIWMFLASEVMLFGAFISSYVILRTGSPLFEIPAREMLGVPLATLNTFVLILSSVTMVLALDSVQKNNQKGLSRYLLLTVLLGFVFLGVKAYEYHHKWAEGITLSSGLFGSFYYTLTGLHALHVVGGIVFNLYILVNALRGKYSSNHHERVEYAGLYWHFVDLVWVILFPSLYLL